MALLAVGHILWTAARLAIGGALVAGLSRLCRKPTGPVGRAVLRSMNVTHASLTAWGLRHVSIGPASTVLDVGCGGGKTIDRLVSMSPDARVFGIDYSPESVAVARDTNQEMIGRGRVDIQLGTVSHLPYPDETFDLVTAVETHYYWPDLARDLAEVRRVLKPGGRLVIIAEAYRGRRNDWLYRPAMRLLLRASYLTPEEHEQLLVAAGYSDVRATVESTKGWISVVGMCPTGGPSSEEMEHPRTLTRQRP